MELIKSLRVPKKYISIAFVGAGGKTTAMFQLARQIPDLCIVSATTHLAKHQLDLGDFHYIVNSPQAFAAIKHRITEGVVLITGTLKEDDRTKGVDEDTLNEIRDFAKEKMCPLFIECDGSRQLPLKAPAEHEPVIPKWVDHVVNVAGLSGIGQLLSDQVVHRLEKFSEISELKGGEIITWDAASRVWTDTEGGLKNIPKHARKTMFLNQADTFSLALESLSITKCLLNAYDSVLVGGLTKPAHQSITFACENTAAVILAAGGSSRLGAPKALLKWNGKTFIRRIAETVLRSGLFPIYVVLGSIIKPIQDELRDLPVKYLINSKWQSGQGSSVALAAGSLTSQAGSAIFFVADQPQISTEIIEQLIIRHYSTLNPIIFHTINGKRVNPVLFDSVTFMDLMNLQGDIGGRSIFPKYNLDEIAIDDERLLMDVDTPEDYQRFLEIMKNE